MPELHDAALEYAEIQALGDTTEEDFTAKFAQIAM